MNKIHCFELKTNACFKHVLNSTLKRFPSHKIIRKIYLFEFDTLQNKLNTFSSKNLEIICAFNQVQ